MLTSFGLFWVGEGAGVHWPGGDVAIVGLVALFALVTVLSVAWLRRMQPAAAAPAATTVADEVAG